MEKERDRFLAYASPATNGSRVAKLELEHSGVPFLHAGYSVTMGDEAGANSYTRLDTVTVDVRRSIPCGWSADALYFLGLTPSFGG